MFQYVSNAGLLFLIGKKRIGIDCLCKDSAKLYQDTPKDIRENLDADILIFTHEHEDHFCAEYVKEAWEKNLKLQIYGTEKVIALLGETDISETNLHVVADGSVLEVDDFNIAFLQSIHEGEQYENVENLTLLINKGSQKCIVTGDAMPCRELFERIYKWSVCIDWLFAPFPYVGISSTRKLMKEHLDIKHIFVLHQPRKESDTQNWVANTKRVCENAKDGLPKPLFPEVLGDWYNL